MMHDCRDVVSISNIPAVVEVSDALPGFRGARRLVSARFANGGSRVREHWDDTMVCVQALLASVSAAS